MKTIVSLWMLVALSACGMAQSSTPSDPGIFMADDLASVMEQTYHEVEACTEMKGEGFTSLRIEIASYPIQCDQHNGKCMAYFTPPNRIQLSFLGSLNHELVHYLLYLKTGDADKEHKSKLFAFCGLPTS